MAFLIVTAITILLFKLVEENIDFFARVQIAFMTNIAYGHRDYTLIVPIMGPMRIIFFALSVVCGLMTLIKLCIPPPIRTRKMVIHHFSNEQQE